MIRRLFRPKTAAMLAVAVVAFALMTVLYFNATPKPKRVEVPVQLDYGVADSAFARDVALQLSAPLVSGNRIEIYQNGDEIFPAQFEAIRQARHHVHIETFQLHDGELGDELIGLLLDRLDNGVEVRFILDFAGSALADFDALKQLEEQGAIVVRWRQPSWYQLARLNHRTHRKLLIVDGHTGFIGGANLTDNWLGVPSEGAYRDNHFRLQGPIVNQLQAAFMDNLVGATGKPLFGADYFPELDEAGEMSMQVVISTPREGRHRIRKLKLMAFASAREHIRLGTAYFFPDPAVLDALIDAAERGVTVEIMMPGTTIDKPFVRMAAKTHWDRLLEAGVQLHEYELSMFHAKLMIIDRDFVSIGSANMDNRSFRINDEANLNVFGRDFADAMIEIYEADKAETRAYDLERWSDRSLFTRIRGWLGRTAGPHL